MLKIKDNVDLKELEKFGFVKVDNTDKNGSKYCYQIAITPFIQGIRVYDNDKIILGLDTDWCINKLNDTIYDLIKADLVEKVSDGNE